MLVSRRTGGSRELAALLLACASATWPNDARGKGTANHSVDHGGLAQRVEAPEARNLEVPYPQGATGSASVTLRLTVDEEGRVSAAHVVDGAEPFASAAREAARAFTFLPARIDGQPAAADITVAVRFQNPERDEDAVSLAEGEKEPDTSGETTSGPAQPWREKQTLNDKPSARSLALPQTDASDDAPIVEVHVIGERLAPDAESMTREEARSIPGTFGDPVRAIEAMPGVVPAISALPYVFVRGAPPGNVGYFVDGIRVPMLWHAFVGPSVLNPATIERVTLHRGGYPARFGRYAGAIVTVDTTLPRAEYAGEASLRLVDAGVMQTVPLRSHDESRLLVSGRYAYLGPVISSLASDTQLGYWDYQLSSEIELGEHDRVGLLALGASDRLHTSAYDSSVRFHRIDPRYSHRFSADAELSAALTFGVDETGSENGSVTDHLVAPRVELHQRFGDAFAYRLGADASFDAYELTLSNDLTYRTIQTLSGVGATRTERTFGSYLDVTWQPSKRVWLSPGVRADVFASGGVTEHAIDPRIATRIEVDDHIAFEHTFGLAHQSASFVPGIPGAAVTNINQGLQRSMQASSSVEYQAESGSFISLTAFDSIYTNLADPLGTEHHFSLDAAQLTERVRGNAYGLEVFFKHPLTERVGGMLSYTLSRSERSYGRIRTLSSLDRTHVASGSLVFNPSVHWQFGARGTFHSGLPTRRASNDGPLFDGNDRTDPFFRLDLRGERRFRLGRRTSLSVVAELLNATFAHETTERSCNDTGCTEVGVGPIVVPNLGVELRY